MSIAREFDGRWAGKPRQSFDDVADYLKKAGWILQETGELNRWPRWYLPVLGRSALMLDAFKIQKTLDTGKKVICSCVGCGTKDIVVARCKNTHSCVSCRMMVKHNTPRNAVRLSTRISNEHRVAIDRLAEEWGTTRALVMREIIQQFFKGKITKPVMLAKGAKL